ncbi:MAG TPA: hypothetical protein VKY92_26265 [Verrucomicrobiae bacterium]|jgi:hypothetical protein|nr:hypothetical protein [Verrucomicrobiae bacterium]
MPLYESRKNAENRIEIKPEWRDAIVIAPDAVIEAIIDILARAKRPKQPLRVAFDGWYGIDWVALVRALEARGVHAGLHLSWRPIRECFLPRKQIASYKLAFTQTDDPGFGVVNTDGHIIDLIAPERLTGLQGELSVSQEDEVLVVYGPGASVPELNDSYDLRFYFDKTRQPILWEMWDGKLIPFGWDEPDRNYGWKEYYYCDYYLLDRQKEFAIARMDYWVEGIAYESLKLVPRAAYDGILQTLVQYPIKEVPIFQPGPWGAYRYKDLFDVPGLECNAWNELAGPELSMLVDVGASAMLNMPTMNLMQYGRKFLGPYLTETYPHLFPMDVWLDDGYFPKPTPAERISMPIHNHPSTDYVRQHFKEPLGRYETYYIAEAYEGANTWMGYKDDADLEEWERLCRASNNLKEIPNWKDFIANWDSNVGDLYLIPPGTTHGHGGNQMVLEMDTCPSIAATEYSFFLYDFARNSWDDKTKTMTGKPCKMHLEHGFDTDKWVRESWVKDHLRVKPQVVKWTKEYMMDRYASDPRMPFEIERLHFERRAENDTQGRFMHIVTLTVGKQVTIRSKSNSAYRNTIYKFQSALVPACFGEYEVFNEDGGACTIVLLRWKKG